MGVAQLGTPCASRRNGDVKAMTQSYDDDQLERCVVSVYIMHEAEHRVVLGWYVKVVAGNVANQESEVGVHWIPVPRLQVACVWQSVTILL